MPPIPPPGYDWSFGYFLLAFFCAGLSILCGRAILVGLGFLAYYLLLPRRDLIIRCGRKAQDVLHLPEGIRAFSRTDPGMTDREIVFGAKLFMATGLVVVAMLARTIELGTVWYPSSILAIGICPALFLLLVWFLLVGMENDRVEHDIPIPMERRRRWMSQAQLDAERASQLTAEEEAEAEVWNAIWGYDRYNTAARVSIPFIAAWSEGCN
jgi:hypothetical protein